MTGFLDTGFGSAVSGGVDVGDIGHSLRCRSAASAYLSKTITTDATSTYFAAVKRGKLGVVSPIFDTNIKFNANDTLTAFGLTTTAVFRDPTSWLFIHVSNGGLYINGVSFGAVTTSALTNPRIGFDGTNYFNGYIARIGCVAGSSSAYTNFGYLNAEINEWVSKTQAEVKAVVDAGGTNSFMLDFDDGTSLTTLGNDFSTKNNDWTLNNFSLTAGTTYDWMLDVPGNSYATLNPIYPSAANITNGNLSSGTTAARGTLNSTVIDSQWFVTAGASAVTAGVIDDSGTTNTTSVTANKVFAFKMTTAGALSYKNITDAGSWTSIATGLTGNRWPYSVTQAASWNFGQQPLPEALDTGFKALCQANLPDVAIKNPKLHFDINTRTGTAATYSVTGLGFQPDLVWSKSRGRAVDHALYDSVRGVQKQLESNSTGAETTETTGLTAFNSDGYTGGALDQINGTTATNSFVDWLWKAGGAAVSNTAGSITSQVSANVDAGFSVVTYTGTGANATVGHGLGVSPKMIIIFERSPAGDDHIVYHSGLTSASYAIRLNTTAAQSGASGVYWNSTAPSTTVFSVGTSGESNQNTSTYVAYCFADIEGYSKVFSYTGNGSADGPYVHLGFKPRWILLKRTDGTGAWIIYDAVRSTYNNVNLDLEANTASAENNDFGNGLDITSSAFKIRDASLQFNASSGAYIGFAIADVAGKYSLGR